MAESPIDSRLESKLGFDRVRRTISDHCSTQYAADRTAAETFTNDPAEIRRRLLLTDEMRLILMFEDRFPTGGYIDCLPFLVPLSGEGTRIDLLSLGKLRTMMETLRKVGSFFSSVKDGVYPGLKHMAVQADYFPEVHRRIDGILDKYGEVKDTASDELYSIRKSLRDKESTIVKKASSIMKHYQDAGIVDADLGLSMRDGKYLIPVSSAHKRQVSGFVYDESASGKTTFIEPAEIVELENEISELRFAETREISRILAVFSDFVRPYVPDLIKGATMLGELDFIMAKAQTALEYIAGMPVISESMEMMLRKARHPLLEAALRAEGKSISPLTVTLTPAKHILLISGPNAGGKSVCLKTTGLLQYMFQWGMLIPTSEASELPVFDRIILSIGDDQSIDNDLSTYSSFLADMRDMLEVADARTLVLIDEFGSGTEPAAGGAIAEAILSELDRRGVYGVITTHYTNLKLYASAGDSGVINGAMLFDTVGIAPLFSLEIGLPGNSFAFELARKTGLPEAIVKDAEEKVGEEFVGIERNLRRIARGRRALDERLQKIRQTDKTLESITEKYEKELLKIKEQRKEIIDEAQKEAETIVKDANREVEKTIRTIRESQADKEKTRQARSELQNFVSALQDRKEQQERERSEYLDKKLQQVRLRRSRRPSHGTADTPVTPPAPEAVRHGPLQAGEKVRVKDNGMVGEVSKVGANAVTIVIGNISSKVPLNRVERISSNEFKAAVKDIVRPPRQAVDTGMQQRKLNFRTEIDLRGERLADALNEVSRYIDDAIMLGVPSVRILHGKGTGVLHDEIQKYLRTVPGVASVADEHIQYGGSGVTVVTLE